MTKTCKTCGETKPIEEFHRGKRYAGGRIPHCKACRKSKAAAEWKQKTPEQRAAHAGRGREWRVRNPEAAAAGRERNRAAIRAWWAENADRQRTYREETHDRRMARDIRLRAIDRGADPATARFVAPIVVAEMDDGVCGICGEDVDPFGSFDLDHIIPLERGGEHSYANVQLAHRSCNRKKQNKVLTDG